MSGKINFLNVVLCEEIRREYSGASIIVGAMPVGPLVDAVSETLIPRLGLYIEAAIKGGSRLSIRLVNVGSTTQVFDASFEMPTFADVIPEEGNEIFQGGVFVVNQENLRIPGAGLYSLQYSCDGSEWAEIRHIFFPSSED